MVLELQRAERMGHALDGVGLAVGEVVGRVDAPGITGARVLGMQDAIEHRVAQVHVARGHVDLGAQHPRAVGKGAGAHLPEKLKALGRRAVAIGAALAGLGQRAPVCADLIGREVVDIGLALLDQVLGPCVELLEVVRGEVGHGAPIEAEPAHVLLDRLDVGHLLLGRVGVVETQVAAPAEVLGDAEIEAERLGMADVQIAVGLRREAGDYALRPPGRQVFANDVADEIARALVQGPIRLARGVCLTHVLGFRIWFPGLGRLTRSRRRLCLPESGRAAKAGAPRRNGRPGDRPPSALP